MNEYIYFHIYSFIYNKIDIQINLFKYINLLK